MQKKFRLVGNGIKNKEELQDLIMEINYCEFCNKGAFYICIESFNYDKEKRVGESIISIDFNSDVDIQEKIIEINNCEFCNNDADHKIMFLSK